MVLTLLGVKTFLAHAAITAVVVATGVVVGEMIYERNSKFKSVIEENRDFEVVYQNSEFNSAFRGGKIKEQIVALEALEEESIISKEEFNKLKLSLVEAKIV